LRIYNCVEPEPIVEAKSPIPHWNGETFLLCIAQHRRNKNILVMIRAFDQLLRSEWIDGESNLVVIGMRGPETARIHRLVREMRLQRSVHLLEGLSEADLQWCYRNCAILAAPSLTEGFGLSIAEGLLAGCRIVCSNIPAHREIGEGSCRFVTLREHPAQALAAAIADALNDLKPMPIELPQFSAPALADEYVTLYRRLIASAAPARADAAASAIASGADISITAPESQSALAYRGK
jgi:glycosyltransferase involved in cell wall biosynthesis